MPQLFNHKRTLQHIPLFSCLQAAEQYQLAGLIIEKRYKKGSVILVEDDSRNYMYVIFSGKIKVVRTSESGKEQILVIRKRGDFFGEITLLDGKSQPATIIAMEDATVGMISKKDFERYFMANEQVLKEIIVMLCARLRESWMMLRVLGLHDAEERLRAVLDFIGSLYGVKDQRGLIIPFKMTHREIADYAALTRETVSRLLSRLNQTGELELLENKRLLLKPALFERRYAAE